MPRIRLLLVGIFASLLAAGCAGTKQPGSQLDGTNLIVNVKAVPKEGWHDPRNDSGYTGLAPGEPKSFETTDYASLDEIVIWVESTEKESYVGLSGSLSIDLGGVNPDLVVGGWGAIWDLRNRTGRTLEVFLRTEDGKVLSLGNVPGPGNSFSPRVSGYVEVLTSAREEPVARVYIAPTPFVQLAKANSSVTFLGMPPGKAKIHSWHPRLPGSVVDVNLPLNRTTTATITVGVNSLPKVK